MLDGRLPGELVGVIYEFDPTFREYFSANVIPYLEIIVCLWKWIHKESPHADWRTHFVYKTFHKKMTQMIIHHGSEMTCEIHNHPIHPDICICMCRPHLWYICTRYDPVFQKLLAHRYRHLI